MKRIMLCESFGRGCLILGVAVFVLLGCNQYEDINHTDKRRVAVPIEINNVIKNITKSIETQPHAVNRVLILPFKKIDESIVINEDDNFDLDQTQVKQVEFSGNPTYVTMLELTENSTYKILTIGYNNNDYDINNAGFAEKFNLQYVTPNILRVFYYESISATDISDLFVTTCTSYNGEMQVGEYFKPEEIKTLKANLMRSVSGLSLEIANVPTSVTSITLIAERLVQSVFLPDMEFLAVIPEFAEDNLKTFSTQTPVGGSVSFNHYLLPTFDINNTRFYLDVMFGTITERYLVIVNDVSGVSLDSRISFYPNQVVKISGNYSDIDEGLILNYSTNLDDDSWDGIQ